MHNRRLTALALLAALAGLCATAFADARIIETPQGTRVISEDNFPAGVDFNSAPAIPLPPLTNTLQPFTPPASTFLFGAETNYWPLRVSRTAPATPLNPYAAAGPAQQWTALGPLAFSRPLDTTGRWDDGSSLVRGLRPLYVEKRDTAGRLVKLHILFPLFNGTRTSLSDADAAAGETGYRWDILNLINHEHTPARNPTTGQPYENQFDIWPFYFSKTSNDPATTYHAIFPIYGRNVTGHLLLDRIDWFLFPLYFHRTLNNVTKTSYLWPIVTRTTGNGYDGFSLWPIFGYLRKPSLVDDSYFLWPFHFHSINTDPDTGAVTDRLAILPFYYRETSPGLRAESYLLLWGHTHRTAPIRYDETRYLWPLWLTDRGDIYRDRFAPFYTHSIVNGRDKTWILWPLWNRLTWDDGAYQYTRTRFFFFLYHDITQKPLAIVTPDGAAAPTVNRKPETMNPAAPAARRTNIWPLLTYWTDGHGRRQLQILSPLEVFLPDNEPTRLIYSPLFALYRYEQAAPGHYRHTLLWNFITCRREPNLREFHLGPLNSSETIGDHKRRALLCGLLGLQKTPGKNWRPFAFKFKSLQQQLAGQARQQAIATAPAIATTQQPLLPRRRI